MQVITTSDPVKKIVENHISKKSSLIAVLQDVQKEFRYLPEEALMQIATLMDVTPARVFSVATFYENFSMKPKGKYVIKICDGTACHVRKSIPILNTLRKELGLSDEKHTTNDLVFTVETVSCLGACGLAPVITVNDKVYAKMTPELTIELLNEIKSKEAEQQAESEADAAESEVDAAAQQAQVAGAAYEETEDTEIELEALQINELIVDVI